MGTGLVGGGHSQSSCEMGEMGTDSWKGQPWLGGSQGLELERWKGL